MKLELRVVKVNCDKTESVLLLHDITSMINAETIKLLELVSPFMEDLIKTKKETMIGQNMELSPEPRIEPLRFTHKDLKDVIETKESKNPCANCIHFGAGTFVEYKNGSRVCALGKLIKYCGDTCKSQVEIQEGAKNDSD
jgi:hypothetical protein